MKNATLTVLAVALAAALAFGVVTRKNLSETKDSLERERVSSLSIARDLESTLEDSESRAGEVERLETELSHAEAAKAEAQERLESIENQYRERTTGLRDEIDSLKAQRDEMEARISAMRLECKAKSAALEDALRLRTEETDSLMVALAQAQREAAGIQTRAVSEKAAIAEESARLQEELESAEARSETLELEMEGLRQLCETRVRELNEEIAVKDGEIARLGNALAGAELASSRLEEKISSSAEIWETRLEEMKEEMARLSASEQEKSNLEALLEEERTKFRMLADECGSLEKTVLLLQKDLEAKEEELAESREAFSALARDRERSERRAMELENDLREALGSLGRLEETIMDASSTMEDLRRQTLELRKTAQQKEHEIETVRSTYESLVTDLRRELERKEVRIERIKDMISLEVVDSILFPPGSATITPEGQNVLLKVGDVLKTIKDRPVRVVGHTDNVPIRIDYRSLYPTNWELSAARACSVVRYFQHRIGLPPSRLEPVGRSFYEPVAANDTPEGRALNRRVTIVIGPKVEMP